MTSRKFEKKHSFAYRNSYQLFYYNTSHLPLTAFTKGEQYNLAEAVMLESKFRTEIIEAENADQVVNILDKQFAITEVTNMPQKDWLDIVEQIIEDHNLIIGRHDLIIPVKSWFKAKRENLTSTTEASNKKKPKKTMPPIEVLEDAVKNVDALNKIYKILIDANLIDKDTKILKEESSGKLGHFVSTIRLFNTKGYFKREPSRDEYLNICNNTFRLNVSKSTVYNHKTRAKTSLTIPPFIPID